MNITETGILSNFQKETIFNLWNESYPAAVGYKSLAELDTYFSGLSSIRHFFLVNDENNIAGWAFTFTRDYEKWFAIIVDDRYHGKGCGRLLLDHLKENEEILNGWMIDSDLYKKEDGTPYASPIGFYIKNDFEVLSDIRLNHAKFSAVKIRWNQPIYKA